MIRHTQKNVLTASSRILLLGLVCLGASSCIWSPQHSHRDDFGPYQGYDYEIWFNSANIYCEYDTEHQRSHWTLVGTPDTSYGTDEIESVWVDILGSYLYTYVNQFELTPQVNADWRYSFDNQGSPENSYHCANHYEFEFTAYDYDGYYTSTWVEW
jgi:hypothetical protein